MSKKQLFLLHHGKLLLPIVVAIVLIGLLFLIRNKMEKNLQDFHQIYQNLASYQVAGQLLRKGSDILTTEVRQYAVTGAASARNDYFKEANVDKHRDRALGMLDGLPGGAEVKKNLAESMNYSLDLMDLEYHAMRLVATEDFLTSPECPAPIYDYHLSEAELRCSPEERVRRAQQLLFGQTYDDYKDKIYKFIDESFVQATKALEENLAAAIASQKKLYLLLGLDLLALLATVFLLVALVHRQRQSANELMRQILDNMPLLFFLKNGRTGTYINANSSFLKFAGKKSVDELYGKDDYAVFDKDTAKNLSDNDAKTLLSHTPITLQDTITDLEGRAHRFRITQFAVNDANGTPCVFGMAADLTDAEEFNSNANALAEVLLCLQKDTDLEAPGHILKIIRERADADYALLARYDRQNNLCTIDKGAFVNRQNTTLSKALQCSLDDVASLTAKVQQQRYHTLDQDDLALLGTAFQKHDNGTIPFLKCPTMISFPIFVHHEIWGNLSLAFKVSQQLSHYEKEFCYRCSEGLAVAVEHLLHYRKLQEAANIGNAPKPSDQ